MMIFENNIQYRIGIVKQGTSQDRNPSIIDSAEMRQRISSIKQLKNIQRYSIVWTQVAGLAYTIYIPFRLYFHSNKTTILKKEQLMIFHDTLFNFFLNNEWLAHNVPMFAPSHILLYFIAWDFGLLHTGVFHNPCDAKLLQCINIIYKRFHFLSSPTQKLSIRGSRFMPNLYRLRGSWVWSNLLQVSWIFPIIGSEFKFLEHAKHVLH